MIDKNLEDLTVKDLATLLTKTVALQNSLVECLDTMANQIAKLAMNVEELKVTVSDLKLNYTSRRF